MEMKFCYSVDSYRSYTCSFIYRNNLSTTYCNIFFKTFFALFLKTKENPTHDHRNMFSLDPEISIFDPRHYSMQLIEENLTNIISWQTSRLYNVCDCRCLDCMRMQTFLRISMKPSSSSMEFCWHCPDRCGSVLLRIHILAKIHNHLDLSTSN